MKLDKETLEPIFSPKIQKLYLRAKKAQDNKGYGHYIHFEEERIEFCFCHGRVTELRYYIGNWED